MIIFKNIKIKNFLSVGNEEINLFFDKNHMTLITGENGSAKSAICIDAIFYALYGKSFRKVTLSNMVNSTNKKNMKVELEFSINNILYKIIRGHSPSIFEIYKDNVLIPQLPNVKDYQNILLDCLKMDEKTFKQLIVVGSSSYTPFLDLSASERRVVIEDLLRIDIFSSMQQIAKQMLSEMNTKCGDIKHELDIINLKIDMQTKNNEDRINEINKQIISEESIIEDYKKRKNKKELEYTEKNKNFDVDQYNNDKEKLEKTSNLINEIEKLRVKKQYSGDTIKKEKEFISHHDVCPTCKRKLEESFVIERLDKLNKKYDKFLSELKLFDDKILELKREKNKYEEKISKITTLIQELNDVKYDIKNISNYINDCKRRIENLEKSKKDNNNNENINIEELKKSLVDNNVVLDNLNIKITAIQKLLLLLKDDGVKSIIIKKYLPIINTLIKKYLDIIGFNISFELDETFGEHILTKTKESYKYNNFSEGEKLRLDMAIMFTFRELAKLQSSISTNILLLDEYDRGCLDSEGANSIVDILKSQDKENIFIISHSPDYFYPIADKILFVEKINGFSHIKETS